MIQNLNKYNNPKGFRGKSVLIVQLWWIVEAVFFAMSPQFLYGWRRFLLRLFGAEIGKGVIIRPSVKTVYPWKLSVGNYSWIGDDVVLYSLGSIVIGENSVVSQKSYLCTGSHKYDELDFPIYSDKIEIKDECWLATDVYVGPGVTINEGTVVGARSSVFKDLPAYKICVGSPVKIIKDRLK